MTRTAHAVFASAAILFSSFSSAHARPPATRPPAAPAAPAPRPAPPAERVREVSFDPQEVVTFSGARSRAGIFALQVKDQSAIDSTLSLDDVTAFDARGRLADGTELHLVGLKPVHKPYATPPFAFQGGVALNEPLRPGAIAGLSVPGDFAQILVYATADLASPSGRVAADDLAVVVAVSGHRAVVVVPTEDWGGAVQRVPGATTPVVLTWDDVDLTDPSRKPGTVAEVLDAAEGERDSGGVLSIRAVDGGDGAGADRIEDALVALHRPDGHSFIVQGIKPDRGQRGGVLIVAPRAAPLPSQSLGLPGPSGPEAQGAARSIPRPAPSPAVGPAMAVGGGPVVKPATARAPALPAQPATVLSIWGRCDVTDRRGKVLKTDAPIRVWVTGDGVAHAVVAGVFHAVFRGVQLR